MNGSVIVILVVEEYKNSSSTRLMLRLDQLSVIRTCVTSKQCAVNIPLDDAQHALRTSLAQYVISVCVDAKALLYSHMFYVKNVYHSSPAYI